jgi:protein-tyrosine-phosphatase
MDPWDALEGAEEVLFLCSGNMLRSPFAELLARHRGLGLPVRSAATTYRNRAIHREAAVALETRGVPAVRLAAFRPTHLSDREPPPGPGTVTFGMTAEHLAELAWAAPEAGPRFLLAELLGDPEEIEDPLFDGAYDSAFARIEACVDALVGRARRGGGPAPPRGTG